MIRMGIEADTATDHGTKPVRSQAHMNAVYVVMHRDLERVTSWEGRLQTSTRPRPGSPFEVADHHI